ncbi:MAG: hypothetical protein ABIY35_00270 [Chitinophagaceae bacterium]
MGATPTREMHYFLPVVVTTHRKKFKKDSNLVSSNSTMGSM